MENITRIAIIDSGAGGVALLRKIVHLPYKFLYIADNKYMPYGDKPQNVLVNRALSLADYAVNQFGAQCIVLACNTLTVAALDSLRKRYSNIAVTGCEPPIKQAMQYTASNVLLVCTEYTANRYSQLALPNVSVLPMSNLASMVEQGIGDKQICEYIAQCADTTDCDCIALGCTHYSHVKHCFERLYPALKIFDSVDGAVARLRKTVIKKHKNTHCDSGVEWYLTEPSDSTLSMYQKLLSQKYQ